MEENKENSLVGRLLAVGIVFALILFGVAAIYAVRVFEKRLGKDVQEIHKNPLLVPVEEEIDEGKPEIPGVNVYDVEEDVEQIELDMRTREAQFRDNIKEKKNSQDAEEERQLLKKKDEFSAKRLAFLRKIEVAETKEERLKLIEELREFCKKK